MIHFNGLYNLRLTVNSWLSGLSMTSEPSVNNQTTYYHTPRPTHHLFTKNKIFRLPGFGSQMGLILVSAMRSLDRGILLKQVWFTVNMGK